jgi:cytosol alanyl aminopeptidase
MRKILLRAGVSVCLLLSVFTARGATPPKLRLQEQQKIEPVSYRAELTLDPMKDTFAGSLLIRLQVSESTNTIWLNAHHLSISSVTFTSGGNNLTGKATPAGDDFVGIAFDTPVPTGPAELSIQYTGEVKKGDTAGLFRVDDKGNSYLLTQFESTDARDVFPSFDEPVYKVPWKLTLHVPAQDTALSNTPIASDHTEGNIRTVEFAETKPLPSYLIAFGVGPFEYVDAGTACKKHIPVRIVVPKGRAAEAKYAAEVTPQILTRLEEYFGIPYPYDKSDQVSVPVTLGFGAMENAGMVTYGQTIILADPSSDGIARQREYASVAAHELAHQWFGDLVTTSWWNDIWLNEAFATWMEQKILAEWKPEWNTRISDVNTKLEAEDQDSLISARQIRQPIESKGDIGAAFDDITYLKGAAVIGMFENWMGSADFRAGVQRYLNAYAFRTATADNFLESLSAGGKNVTAAFSTFLNQPGVPMVSAALACNDGAKLHLEQKRSVPIGSEGVAAQQWSIPLCVRYGLGSGTASECTLMTEKSMDFKLTKTQSCPTWLQANDAAKGYYQVNYQGNLLHELTEGDIPQRLPGTERVDLIGNAAAGWTSGDLPGKDALGLVDKFHNDPERLVVVRALNLALLPNANLVPEDLRPKYRQFLLTNFQARARQLGWTPHPGESDDVRLLRPTLLRAVSTVGGDQELGMQAVGLADQWLKDPTSVSPDVRDAVLRTAAYYGDRALFDRFFAAYQKTEDSQLKQSLLIALIGFRDKQIVQDELGFVESGKVPLPDGIIFLFAPGSASPALRKLPFEAVEANYDQLLKNHPNVFGFGLATFLPQVGDGLCDPQDRQEYASFFGPRVNNVVGASRPYAQTLEKIDLCIALKKAQAPSVAAFLQTY